MEYVGRYPIAGVIGQGGFGTVYLAHHTDTGRPVAIKVLDNPDQDWRRDLFRAEAAALLAVDHPHVVRVHEVIDAPGLLALVTDYIDGASLRQVLDRHGTLSGPQALHVLTGALAGLTAVHAAGLVHADLKPENILIDSTGTSRLIDFGLTGPARPLAGPDTWIGTPTYLAPEVVLGTHIDHRSDIYAAAVILFELLTGRPPYRGPNPVMTALLHVQSDIPDPRHLNHEVSEPLAQLTTLDLAKQPAARHQNTPALATSLEYAATETYGPEWRERALTGPAAAAAAGAGAGGLGAIVAALVASLPTGAGLLGSPPLTAATAALLAGTAGAGIAGGGGIVAAATGTGGASSGVTGGGAGVAGISGAAGGASSAASSTGALATLGSTKGIVAAVAAIATTAALGTGAVLYLNRDDVPAAPAPVAGARIVAAFTTSTGAGDDGYAHQVHTLASDGSITEIAESAVTGYSAPPITVSPDGGHIATEATGRGLVVRAAAAPYDTAVIDCACRSPHFADDNSLVALTGASIEVFDYSGNGWAHNRSVPFADGGPRDIEGTRLFRANNDPDLVAIRGDRAFVLAAEAYADQGSGLYLADFSEGGGQTADTEMAFFAISTAVSPDGRHLAVGKGSYDGEAPGGLSVIDLDSAGTDGTISSISWDLPTDGSDADFVAFAGPDVLVHEVTYDEDWTEMVSSARYRRGIKGLTENGVWHGAEGWQLMPEIGVAWSEVTTAGSLTLRDNDAGTGYDLWLDDAVVSTNVTDVELVPTAKDDAPDTPAPSTTAAAPAAPIIFDPIAEIDGTGDTSAIAALPQELQDLLAATARTTYEGDRTSCDIDVSYPEVTVEVYDPRGYARGGVNGCSGYNAIWRLDPTGWVETWAGNGVPQCSEFDGSQLPAAVLYNGVWSCYDGDEFKEIPGRP